MAARAGGRLTFDALKKFVADRAKSPGYESIFDQLKVVSGGDGNCSCELVVSPKMLNDFGTLHGGVTASLVDAVSTYALTTTGSGRPGSSVDLNISYLRPVKVNEVITISARTLSCGRTIAFSCVDITKTNTGQLVAQGRHSKFVGEPKTSGSSTSS
uniref:Acyl-coenzyme A thioesterase 13 n=2 Tax=Arion vulgaris TaxID=1028688 RepID=A0A0B6ZV12_9EUPU